MGNFSHQPTLPAKSNSESKSSRASVTLSSLSEGAWSDHRGFSRYKPTSAKDLDKLAFFCSAPVQDSSFCPSSYATVFEPHEGLSFDECDESDIADFDAFDDASELSEYCSDVLGVEELEYTPNFDGLYAELTAYGDALGSPKHVVAAQMACALLQRFSPDCAVAFSLPLVPQWVASAISGFGPSGLGTFTGTQHAIRYAESVLVAAGTPEYRYLIPALGSCTWLTSCSRTMLSALGPSEIARAGAVLSSLKGLPSHSEVSTLVRDAVEVRLRSEHNWPQLDGTADSLRWYMSKASVPFPLRWIFSQTSVKRDCFEQLSRIPRAFFQDVRDSSGSPTTVPTVSQVSGSPLQATAQSLRHVWFVSGSSATKSDILTASVFPPLSLVVGPRPKGTPMRLRCAVPGFGWWKRLPWDPGP